MSERNGAAPHNSLPWQAAGSVAWAVGAGLASLGALSSAQAQAPAATEVVEVQAGDSFSGIAGRILGNSRQWSQLYDARLTGLNDPNRILVGMRFELVTEPGGKRYLRLVGSRPVAAAEPAAPAVAQAPARPAPPAPAPAAAPAPTPAPAPAAAPPAPVAAAPAPAPAPAAAGDGALVIGVLPNIPAAALQAQYENLRAYFERTQNLKVRIVIPPNFKVFFDNTLRGEYDVAVAAPHFARVAQVDRGLVPLVSYEPRINALFVAKPDDGVTAPADMRGKAVGFANPTSLVALYGLQWFRQAGLEPNKDFEVKGARTDMGVGRMLLAGEAAGAVMSNGEFRALPQDESSRLRVVEAFVRFPNFVLMAHPRLGTPRINSLKASFKAFIADKDEGAAFVRATGVSGIIDADEPLMRELDPYVVPTRRAMGYTN